MSHSIVPDVASELRQINVLSDQRRAVVTHSQPKFACSAACRFGQRNLGARGKKLALTL